MIQVTFADRARAPHPLVGIETLGDWPPLLQAIEAAAEACVPGMVFDVQRVVRTSPTGLTEALLNVPPFYERGARPSGPLH
ncbi:MAG TPA: enhanced serine sensitivity protein SseB C-terminal domain-containing protein, partial [Rhizomicrobium sp.]